MTTIDPKLAMQQALAGAGQNSGDALVSKLKKAAASDNTEELRKAAKQFEAFFMKMMLKEMREASSNKDGLFGGHEMETFNSMFDDEIASRVSEGEGSGLASFIMRAFDRNATPEAPVAASFIGRGSSKVLTPAPVLANGREGYSWPLPDFEPGRISSHYGRRHDPLEGHWAEHRGLDIAAPPGTPVLAMSSGVVTKATRAGAYGQVVFVDHGDGVVTRYAHQDRIDVRVGQKVKQGQQIGTVGSTGRSTGAHLHVEVRVGGKPLDPHDFLSGSHE